MYVIPQDGAHSGPMMRTANAITQRPVHGQTGDIGTTARAEAKRRQMKLAAMIEPDAQRISEWWVQDPIAELGSLTADQLIAQGMESLLEQFLLAIIFGDRSVRPVR